MSAHFTYYLLSSLFVFGACTGEKKEIMVDPVLFEQRSAIDTGIDFANHLTVNDSMNYFQYGYFYMGGGVAVGDVNNDGLQDLYFTGNQVANRLYLNKGNLKFEDISKVSGVLADSRWVTGCAMSDVNADGLMDIYVSVAGKWQSRKNILYINQGLDDDGVPHFEDQAEAYGLADSGYSIQATFLDYDNDGDNDVFVANYEPTPFNAVTDYYRQRMDKVRWEQSGHLYRNNGDHTFSDVTEEAGLLAYGMTVGVISSDFNNDGHADLYLSNDFNLPDYFYLNNGDGTFKESLQETMPHTAFYGMGVDAADHNNDGLLDLMQVDMAPFDHFREKANMSGMNISGFWANVKAGFHYQYMYNVLQVNKGIRDNGKPFFGDHAKISGMDRTDWSWAPLMADFDNDGLKDLFISNGTRRDINNRDFFRWIERMDISLKLKYNELSFVEASDRMPSKKMDNFIFKNNGQRFEKVNKQWNLKFEGFSNGAAYADLDNDGDLEIIINNIDSVATVFENRATDFNRMHYLQVKLKGPKDNPNGLGTKVYLKTKAGMQYQEHTTVRGYQSSVGNVLHFGLGNQKEVLELKVQWPDGKAVVKNDIKAGQCIGIAYGDAVDIPDAKAQPFVGTKYPVFSAVGKKLRELYLHEDSHYNDFEKELLLPHKLSQLGPALAVADIDNDGREDFYIGGAIGSIGYVFRQLSTGEFEATPLPLENMEKLHEDIDAIFVDMDNDGDQDLYVVSGSNEYEEGSVHYQDRVYSNDGKGRFRYEKQALPQHITSSGSCVRPIDYDADGDIDLLVGGRYIPGRYPMPASSQLLENKSKTDKIVFKDVTDHKAPDLKNIGMVSDALWQDFDQDGDMDMILVGEWMPITVLENRNGNWRLKSDGLGIAKSTGWWNCIEAADFDNDGDEDFVLGNLGLNYKYKADKESSFDIYAHDFDGNGNLDIVLGYYEGEEQFPVRGKQCSSEQMPTIAKKFKDYNSFASADLEQIYTPDALEKAIHYQAWNFASVYIENQGKGRFKMKTLPDAVQVSSINDIVVMDYDQDGHQDMVMGGNLYVSEVETPRNDAGYGFLLKGKGNGEFKVLSYRESGFYIPFDTKKIAPIQSVLGQLIAFANNDGPLILYKKNERKSQRGMITSP